MELRDQLESALGATYTIERELGGGGMSRVFVATESALGRRVVIKIVPIELGAGVNLDRFKREIAARREPSTSSHRSRPERRRDRRRAVLHDAVHRRRVAARAARRRVRCR